ncbi:MAG: DUF503 domain-containing protein [Peptococcaceae bacterium]|nr:DUF503 domain-containing protein [Peptococcaceae bacterium]
MFVGVLTVELLLSEGHSLKDKRRVLKSLIERVRNRFNASVAEVGDLEMWRRSSLAMSMVSNDQTHINKTFDSIIGFIEARGELTIIDYHIQMY